MADYKELEAFILAENKQDFLKTLIAGTDSYYFFSMLIAVNQFGGELPKDVEALRKAYESFGGRYSNIRLRLLLTRFQEAKTDEQRRQILEDIRYYYLSIKFDHPQPSNVSTAQFIKEETKISDKLNPDLVDSNKIIANLITGSTIYSRLRNTSYRLLDLSKIQGKQTSTLINFLSTHPDLASTPGIVDFIHKASDKYKKEGDGIGVGVFYERVQVFQRLTLVQLQELMKKDKDLWKNRDCVASLFTKTFKTPTESAILSSSQEESKQRMDKLKAMYQWCQSNGVDKEFESLSDQLLYEYLQVGIECDVYDKDLFIKFIQRPKKLHSLISEKVNTLFNSGKKNYDQYWHKIHQLNTGRWMRDEELIQIYLERFFQTADNIKAFEDYINPKQLTAFLTAVKLQQGKQVANLTDILKSDRIQELNNAKEIKILKTNKTRFAPGEAVKLQVDIKNISNLLVKVFEINTENYYRKSFAEFESATNLDGLTPSEEKIFEYKEPPIVKSTKEIAFDLISKAKRGLFVIEFIGNGLTSRAIIKKGALLLQSKEGPTGQRLMILDEEFNVCKGESTGILLDSRVHRANADGVIFIPFVNAPRTEKIVLLHDGFAELSVLNTIGEQYRFACQYLYSFESLLNGNTARILIKPRLTLNSNEAPLSLLKETAVTITATSTAGIPTTSVFDNQQIDNTGEIEIDYAVGAKLSSILIEVKSKVKTLLSGGKDQDLSNSKQIDFQTYASSDQFTNMYLRLTKNEGYQIYVLGKNGEPRQNMALSISLANPWDTEPGTTVLSTNSEGCITLGPLNEIMTVSASLRETADIKAISAKWVIKDMTNFDVPQSVQICETDNLRLPLIGKQNEITLFEMSGSEVISDLAGIVKVDNGIITLPGLKEGGYILKYLATDQNVSIQVLAGKYWGNSELIITKNRRMVNARNPLLNNLIFFKTVEVVNDGKKTESDLVIKLQVENQKTTRVHVILNTFAPSDVNQHAKELLTQLATPALTKVVEGKTWRNVFLNNRTLGDEYCYVLDRKQQKRFIGNTLERPHVLLKTTFIQETYTEQENLEGGGEFQKEAMADMDMRDLCGMAVAGSADLRPASNYATGVDTFLNFLKNPARILSNLKPNEKGEVIVPSLNLSEYSSARIFVMNEYSVISKTIPLERSNITVRDLRQKVKDSKDRYSSHRRNTTKLLGGASLHFDDFTATEMQVVDSIAKAFDLQKELQKLSGRTTDHGESYDMWSFVKDWQKLPLEEKHKKYDKFACHELNILLYFKDKEYFTSFAAPFIRNKIEKTFVDYFLLNNSIRVRVYLQPSLLQTLNMMERILLQIHCLENGLVDEAKLLGEDIQNQGRLIHISTNDTTRYFDTVLNSKKDEASFSALQEQAAKSGAKPMAMARGRMMKDCEEKKDSEELFCMDEDDFDGDPSSAAHLMDAYAAPFVKTENAKEYAERQYYFQKSPEESRDLIKVNAFWSDLAVHLTAEGLTAPFLSNNFVYAGGNHTECLGVLAFLTLPFDTSQHKIKADETGRGVTFSAGSNLIVFHKEIKESQAELRNDILITQRYYDPKDRYQRLPDDPTLQVEKDVSEFIVNRVYGCQVIVTNCSVIRQELQVLVEIPEGAIPVITTDYTKSHTIVANSFSTQTIEFSFYFPSAGSYTASPSNVAKNGKVLATATASQFEVLKERKQIKLESLNDILMTGSKKDVINFVKTKNLYDRELFNFQNIYWLLRDREFYNEFIPIMRSRKIYDSVAWSYSIQHGDLQTAQEYFRDQSVIAKLQGYLNYIDTTLVSISRARLLEYQPLVNARAHKLPGAKSNILNRELREQYVCFLRTVSEKKTVTALDNLALVYYLLLQDRIEDAIKIFAKIKPADLAGETEGVLQYDYLTAYLDFYRGAPNFKLGREICGRYLDYPVHSWRSLFIEIANQLAEFDGEELIQEEGAKEDESIAKKNLKQALKEETLTLELNGTNMVLNYQNITGVTVDYFVIDLEFLFSRNPFLLQGLDDFSFVKPNRSDVVKLDVSTGIEKKIIALPEELVKANVFILIAAANKRVSTTYFSTKLTVQILENYGQVKVLEDETKPASKVYVKTFAKMNNGTVTFYKDGYTDLRGRFDYAALNNEDVNNVQKFAIFIMSDELGSIIKEANPPKKLGRYDEGLKLRSKRAQEMQSNLLIQQERNYISKSKK